VVLQRIHLPKFPGFSTLIGTAPAHGMEDSGFDMHMYRSYGSLNTDHTGRSLDTFGSLCGPLSEHVEEREPEVEEETEVVDVTAQVHRPVPRARVAEIEEELEDEDLF